LIRFHNDLPKNTRASAGHGESRANNSFAFEQQQAEIPIKNDKFL
jgi:hypothetical protein